MNELPVMVVEDDHQVRVMIEDALEEAGFRISLSGDAAAAIAALETPGATFAALVTDIRLGPGQRTGWDVARRARELNGALPVVYMTGNGSGDWASKGVPNSILITKPFAPAQVVTAVSQLLNLAPPLS